MEVNYLAVVVTALINVVWGMVWWSDMLFGKKWRKLMGIGDMSKEEMNKKMKEQTPAHVTSAVTSLLVAFLFSGIVDALDITTIGGAIRIAVTAWLFFVATTTLVDYMYAKRNMTLWAINYVYSLFGFAIMSTILALWK